MAAAAGEEDIAQEGQGVRMKTMTQFFLCLWVLWLVLICCTLRFIESEPGIAKQKIRDTMPNPDTGLCAKSKCYPDLKPPGPP